YGVGNHGGGPTKKNIESIRALIADHKETKLVFSDTMDLFDAVRAKGYDLPVVRDELQHHASGCYAAVSAVKDGIRRAECALGAAENFAMMTCALGVRPQPDPAAFRKAWKNVLFHHFHDSFGGCSLKEVYDDAALFLGESRAFAAREENRALQTLSWQIDTMDGGPGSPVILFNPHPFPVEETVVLNKRRERIFAPDGREVPAQLTHSPRDRCSRLSQDTVFIARVPAFGYAAYRAARDTDPVPAWETDLSAGQDFLENAFLRVEFETHTGQITRFFDKTTGKERVAGRFARPVVIDEADHDTWSHAKNFFDREVGEFIDGRLTLLESGPVRARMKVVSRFGRSTLTQIFTMASQSRRLDVEAKIDWHEHRKMLKLRFETGLRDAGAWYEIPFAAYRRPQNGEEQPGQSWIALNDGQTGLAVLNDNKYSSSAKEGDLDLTVVRSPYYLDHGRGEVHSDDFELTDQGESRFRYALLPWDEPRWGALTRLARAFNTPLTQILENNHPGRLPRVHEGLTLAPDSVILSAIKRAEDGLGTVVRVYETEGKKTVFTLSGQALPLPLTDEIGAFSVETYYLPDGGDAWKKVLMTEYDG
ncbi:MAG: hypothetical protein II776_04540, partial [Clostridia bacterium]|nr:hypothetical protein [Clostridia bacterium]